MRSTKAFTLIETLIAMVIGVISVAAISYSYISMMGDVGLKRATQVAILNANYIKTILK